MPQTCEAHSGPLSRHTQSSSRAFWTTCCPSFPAAGNFHISTGCWKPLNGAPLLLSFKSGSITSETASPQSASASQRIFTQRFTSVRQTSSNVKDPYVRPMDPPPENVRLARPRSKRAVCSFTSTGWKYKHRIVTSDTNRGRCHSEKDPVRWSYFSLPSQLVKLVFAFGWIMKTSSLHDN